MPNNTHTIPYNALILAGQRAHHQDPICIHYGITRKVLLKINDKPMLHYVCEAVRATAHKNQGIWLSGLSTEGDEGDEGNADNQFNLPQTPAGKGPAQSILNALAPEGEKGIDLPVLITTGDHPLLRPEIIDDFIAQARAKKCDFAIGFATREAINHACPHTKRTYLRFSDVAVSGCNLFYINDLRALSLIQFWQKAQHLRKQPHKLAWQFGISILARWLVKRLSLDNLFDHISKRFDVNATYVLLPFGEAAIDVDKPSDVEIVSALLVNPPCTFFAFTPPNT